MEAKLVCCGALDVTDYNNTMDLGCLTSSRLRTWPAVYAGQVPSAILLINTPSCTIDEE